MQSKNCVASEDSNNQNLSTNRLRFSSRLLMAVLLFCAITAVSETHAATINVDRTDDTAAATACTATANDCCLRGAFAFANANSGTVINIPAGTYNLSIDELRVGTATNISTTISGAGANLTIINQTIANRRVINLNPSLAANVVVNISGIRITGGNSPTDNFGGGGLIGGGAGNTLNLSNCIFDNNVDSVSSTPKGGGIEWAGGGFLNIDNCTFNNNTAGTVASNLGVGGGVDYQLLNLSGAAGQGGLSITNSTFTNNKAGASNSGAGGGLAIVVTTTQTPRTVTVTNNTFTGNQANAASNGRGGAITSSSSSPSTTIKFNRIVNNTATGGIGTGIYQSTGTVGTINATENWWGCNLGPNNPGCDSIGGVTTNITTSPRIVLTHTVNPNPIIVGQSTTVTASFLLDSAGTPLTLASISRLLGLPIIFNPVRGTISNAQTTIQPNGTAAATFNSNAAGAGSVATVVDNSTDAIASITINKADTAIIIVSDTPDPTVTGQSYVVTFNAPTVAAFGIGAPTGTVTISDGTNSCTATLPALSCNLISLTVGEKNLTATYNGDANYNASPASSSIPHTVTRANTTVAIIADTPDPSVFGQDYTVSVSVTVNSPGGGTPGSGTITVSDGTNNCTITLPATGCTLPSDSVGTKNLTAVYNGDANYFASPPSATVSHVVNQDGTTTTITSTLPNPSNTNQNVVVSYTVTAAAPGAGTPTGTVTISDGTNSCTGTVADGQCTIVFSSGGSYNLTATYSGDTNFTSSSSTIFTQQVCNTSGVMVTNTGDSGTGSLRQAVIDICAGGTITFDASFNTPQTITLTSGEILIDRDITISGTGANLLTINANNLSRAFLISGGIVNLSGMTITGGNADGDGNGGAINHTGGTLTLTNSVVSGSTAPNLGGGVYSIGSLTITGSTISGSTANNAGGATGGGIHAVNLLMLVNSTVSGNFAPNGNNNGGGVRAENNASIISSTITNNSAGGANSASGVFRTVGRVTIRNSIVAANQNNTAVPDVAGAFAQNSQFNLIGNVGTSTGFAVVSDSNQTGTGAAPLDPRLSPLSNNGGATLTHALLADSPGIDKGNSFNLSTDQRGLTRPVDITSIPNASNGDASDIGAFELQLAPTAATVSVSGRVTTASGRGIVSIRLSLTDSSGQTRTATTTTFGYYRFTNVNAGETYIITAKGKRFEFAQPTQILNVNEDADGVNFVAN